MVLFSLSLSLKISISLDSKNGDESDGRGDNEDVQRGTEGGGWRGEANTTSDKSDGSGDQSPTTAQ